MNESELCSKVSTTILVESASLMTQKTGEFLKRAKQSFIVWDLQGKFALLYLDGHETDALCVGVSSDEKKNAISGDKK